MNDAEKKLAEELLANITVVNASQRLEDYKLLLDCVSRRQQIEGYNSIKRALEAQTATGSGTPTGTAAIDNA